MWKNVIDEDKKKFEEKGYAITYGELTLEGLKKIMNKVDSKKDDKVFVDLGSGNGNIVINAIKEHPNLYKSIGIEFSKSRHETAENNLKKQKASIKKRVKFLNNDILDDGFDYSDFDIIYISNLCFSDEINKRLSEKINNECNEDTHIFCSRPLHQLSNIPPPKIFQVPQTWISQSNINYYKL
jgi:ubiquinone/menaquinone biosynthesis C-methylase UbiE